ncbi:MAG: DUF2884 family protein [Gammaproteobacteria bacterium]|nr:DUF2884 family protein [Gammaproteobacteria bacterium]
MNMTKQLTTACTILLGIALAGPLAAHPHDDHGSSTPMCDRLDRETSHVTLNGDFNFNDDEIVLRDEDDRELMVITEDRELFYKGEKLALSQEGQVLVNTYYETFSDAMNDFTDLAGDAAGIGVDTATTVLAALFSGDINEAELEAKIEAKAAKIEASADAACARLASLEQIELAMAEEIDGFEPVLFQRD